MANVNTNIQAAVGAGANYDIIPPIGEDWEVTDIGSSAWVGVPPNMRPEVDAGIFDGTLGPALILRSIDNRGWYRRQHLEINHTNYLRLNNPGLAAANISISAQKILDYGVGTSIVKTDVQALGAGLTYAIQPPAGEDWMIRDIGSDQWVGAKANGLPNIQVDITDGTLTAMFMHGAEVRQWEPELELYANHDNYIQITNLAAIAANVCFVAEMILDYGVGTSIVKTAVQNCLALGDADFQPPAGEEWTVTGLAAGSWVGVSPLMFPDVTAHLYDGVNASEIMDQRAWQKQGHRHDTMIDNTDYLRITDTSATPNVVGISAVLTRRSVR